MANIDIESNLLKLIPDIVVEHLLPHRPQGRDRRCDARVQLAVWTDPLHHVHIVAVLPSVLHLTAVQHQPVTDPALRVVEVLLKASYVQI
jgi:hypothetical protein